MLYFLKCLLRSPYRRGLRYPARFFFFFFFFHRSQPAEKHKYVLGWCFNDFDMASNSFHRRENYSHGGLLLCWTMKWLHHVCCMISLTYFDQQLWYWKWPGVVTPITNLCFGSVIHRFLSCKILLEVPNIVRVLTCRIRSEFLNPGSARACSKGDCNLRAGVLGPQFWLGPWGFVFPPPTYMDDQLLSKI